MNYRDFTGKPLFSLGSAANNRNGDRQIIYEIEEIEAQDIDPGLNIDFAEFLFKELHKCYKS